MARAILWLAAWCDGQGYWLQRNPWRSWRCRLGVCLERIAFSRPVVWASRRERA